MARTDGPSIRPGTFPASAKLAVRDTQLRRNIRKATQTIRAKRERVTAELPDWEELREAGRALKAKTLAGLDRHLVRLEESVTQAGGRVHWARDGSEANRIIEGLIRATGSEEVIKVKSMTTDETGLNEHLKNVGIRPVETDLADLIVQLGDDRPSHILVPAIHKNRAEIRSLFRAKFGLDDLSDEPAALAGAARSYLRDKFLTVPVGVSGANFAVAETGSVCVVESEGNGRMCTTLPRTLISVMGIEKVIPSFRDLEVFLQLLPRSSTGERMNPYTSLWSGVRPGDGPEAFHLVLLDNGRSDILADAAARPTLNCIRCSACLNICPVYARTGGHAYNSIYPGPIGAILTPQLYGLEAAGSLPYASTLCGACYAVCPVKIDIPEVLLHLRGRVVEADRAKTLPGGKPGEALVMKAAMAVFTSRRRYEAAQRLARLGQLPFRRGDALERLPGPLAAWTETRDMKAVPARSFRDWWRGRRP